MRSTYSLAFVLLLLLAPEVSCQRPGRVDPGPVFAAQARRNLAAMVLARRSELALDRDQVKELESAQADILALAQRAAATAQTREGSRDIMAFRVAMSKAHRRTLTLLRPEQVQELRRMRPGARPPGR